jgi:hypothetical protein
MADLLRPQLDANCTKCKLYIICNENVEEKIIYSLRRTFEFTSDVAYQLFKFDLFLL